MNLDFSSTRVTTSLVLLAVAAGVFFLTHLTWLIFVLVIGAILVYFWPNVMKETNYLEDEYFRTSGTKYVDPLVVPVANTVASNTSTITVVSPVSNTTVL